MHKSVLCFAPYGGKQAYRHRILLATFCKENTGLSGRLVMFVAVFISDFKSDPVTTHVMLIV